MDIVNGRNKEPLISLTPPLLTTQIFLFRFPFAIFLSTHCLKSNYRSGSLNLSQPLCNNIFPLSAHTHTNTHFVHSRDHSLSFRYTHTHSAFLFWAPVPLRKIHQEAMTSAWSDNIMPLRQRANILRLKLNWAWKLIGDEWYRKRTSVPPSS